MKLPRSKMWSVLLAVAVLVALILFPFITSHVFYVMLCVEVLILSIVAMSYDLLIGYTGAVSFAHAAFFGTGAYISAILLKQTALPFPVILLVVLAMVIVLAIIIGFLSLRLTGIYFAMITFAFGQLIYTVIYKWKALTGGDEGMIGIPGANLFFARLTGGRGYTVQSYFIILSCAILCYVLLHRVVRSPFGHVLQAIRENEGRAEIIGYNTFSYKLRAFILSAVIAGFAGALAAPWWNYVSPDLASFKLGGQILVISIIGGVGTLTGAVVGSAIYIALEQILSGLTQRWLLLLGVVYVLFVMFIPYGIVGSFRVGRQSVMDILGRLTRGKKDRVCAPK